MKKSVFLLLIMIISNGCGQNKKKLNRMITKEQYNNISKEVKTFNYNPIYQLKVNVNLCTYEIYVNDVLVHFSFSTGQTAGEQNIDIPQYILKSGKQTVRYKIYPKAIKDGVLEEMMDSKANFSLRIVHGEYYKENFASFKEDLNLSLPKLTTILPFFEFSSAFQATVPYELNGWSDGVDLTIEDSKKLEKEVLSVYNKYRTAWLNKDVSVIASMIYKREKEIAQSNYMTSDKEPNYNNGWEELEEKSNAIIKMNPIDDYEIKIMGNKKLVQLHQTKGINRNWSVIFGETKEDYVAYDIILFRPKLGAPLEVIR